MSHNNPNDSSTPSPTESNTVTGNTTYTAPFFNILKTNFQHAYHNNQLLSFYKNPREAQILHSLSMPFYWGFGCGLVTFACLRGAPQRLQRFYYSYWYRTRSNQALPTPTLKTPSPLVENPAMNLFLEISLSIWIASVTTQFLSGSTSHEPISPVSMKKLHDDERQNENENQIENQIENENIPIALDDITYNISQIPFIPGQSQISNTLCTDFINAFEQNVPKQVQAKLLFYPPTPTPVLTSHEHEHESSASSQSLSLQSQSQQKQTQHQQQHSIQSFQSFKQDFMNDGRTTTEKHPSTDTNTPHDGDDIISVNSTLGTIANFVYSCKARKAHEAHLEAEFEFHTPKDDGGSPMDIPIPGVDISHIALRSQKKSDDTHDDFERCK